MNSKMEPWKITYLRRLGMGLFTSILLDQMKIIEGLFQGIVITLMIPILIYGVRPVSQASGEKE